MMHIHAATALWFLPLVLPFCAATVFFDLAMMRIPNWINYGLAAVFVLVGMIAMPTWPEYGRQLVHLPIGIAFGMFCFYGGLMGGGDAKFIGAAAPFVAFGDLAWMALLFSAALLGGYATHRLAKYTFLRQLAPEWKSWNAGYKFPMGFCLGGSLVAYLGLAAVFGQ